VHDLDCYDAVQVGSKPETIDISTPTDLQPRCAIRLREVQRCGSMVKRE